MVALRMYRAIFIGVAKLFANRQSAIQNHQFFYGVLAQLVERLNGIEEVRGSNPLGSSLRSQRSGGRRLSRRNFVKADLVGLVGTNAASFDLASQGQPFAWSAPESRHFCVSRRKGTQAATLCARRA